MKGGAGKNTPGQTLAGFRPSVTGCLLPLCLLTVAGIGEPSRIWATKSAQAPLRKPVADSPSRCKLCSLHQEVKTTNIRIPMLPSRCFFCQQPPSHISRFSRRSELRKVGQNGCTGADAMTFEAMESKFTGAAAVYLATNFAMRSKPFSMASRPRAKLRRMCASAPKPSPGTTATWACSSRRLANSPEPFTPSRA